MQNVKYCNLMPNCRCVACRLLRTGGDCLLDPLCGYHWVAPSAEACANVRTGFCVQAVRA